MTGARESSGSALLATAAGLLAILVVLSVALALGALLQARAVASTAADHAALAAAGAHAAPGGDPAGAAAAVAAAMDARVTRCDCGALPVQVQVAVDLPDAPLLVRVVGPSVSATGHASLVPP